MLFVHFIGLAMGIGTSFAFLFLGLVAKKMEKEEAIQFQLKTFALSKMGHIGLTLSVISGGYLMTPYWSVLGQNPLLLSKLILVVALGALIGIISSKSKKAKLGDAELHLKKIEPLGKMSFFISVSIVILAVISFH